MDNPFILGIGGRPFPGGNTDQLLRVALKADPSNKLTILADIYGLNGARELGRRAVELSRIIKAGTLSLSSDK